MAKRKKKSPLKKLQKKCEDLWKLYCLTRDGRACRVKFHFPGQPLSHSEIFQVDHCFSRKNKDLFLDTRNGTVVCGNCNMAKGFGQKSVSRLIDDIVKLREGEKAFNEMREIDLKSSPSETWKSIPELEKIAIDMTLKISELLNAKTSN